MNDLIVENDSKPSTEWLETVSVRFLSNWTRLWSLRKKIQGAIHEINTPLAILRIRTDQLLDAA